MSIASRRRAMMAQDKILWEWNPGDGLSKISFTASTGCTPSYELLQDCIRIKGPSSSALKQTKIVISNPPALSGKIIFMAHIKNFPVNGIVSNVNGGVGAMIIANTTGSFVWAEVIGHQNSEYRQNVLRGATTTRIQWTSLQSEFDLELMVDTQNNTTRAFFPDGQTLSDYLGGPVQSAALCSIEAAAPAYFDITHMEIRRTS